ncbi:hypothetical protein EU546_01760 [Candidatus Thorarchaeota archaeon]|nr:MAG: hypothetical protein EU546_01760 [Candidatus Thorarchaeota archaeon]
MLQIYFESLFLPFSIIFIILGIIAFGWLIVHVEQSRHYSIIRIALSLVLGAFLLGFGIHFLLLSFGT